jgi:hypothetical protein
LTEPCGKKAAVFVVVKNRLTIVAALNNMLRHAG